MNRDEEDYPSPLTLFLLGALALSIGMLVGLWLERPPEVTSYMLCMNEMIMSRFL